MALTIFSVSSITASPTPYMRAPLGLTATFQQLRARLLRLRLRQLRLLPQLLLPLQPLLLLRQQLLLLLRPLLLLLLRPLPRLRQQTRLRQRLRPAFGASAIR